MSELTQAPPALPFAGVPNVISIEGAVKEACSENGPSATVRYFVLYGQRWAFAKSVLGTSFPAGSRTIPQYYPPWTNLYALSIGEMGGIGKPTRDGSGWLAWSYAYVDVVFGVPPYRFDGSDPSGVAWSATSMHVAAEDYPAPMSAFTFPSGSVMTTNPMIPLAVAEITIRRRWLPVWAGAQVASIAGTVNSGTFLGFAPGYLKFNGAELPEPGADPVGNHVYDAIYSFSWRNIPWNQELDPNGTFGWATPVDGNGNPKIPSSDFTILP